jgi:hypothetical protein
MKELTNYEQWQINKYGNICGNDDTDMFEAGIEELTRLAEYIDLQSQLQDFQHQENYPP